MPRRLLVSFFFVLLISWSVKGDPILIKIPPPQSFHLPSGTVLSGTITANRNLFRSIEGNLNTLDPDGNLFLVGFASQGGSLQFQGLPGTLVVFQAGISGSADQGNTAIQVSFTGTGPVIPNVDTPTLDLIGTANVQFFGTVFASHTDMFLVQNPLFTISGSFSGPVALHFVRMSDGSYLLETATVTLTAVPEPISLLLFGSGLSAAIASRRFFKNRHS